MNLDSSTSSGPLYAATAATFVCLWLLKRSLVRKALPPGPILEPFIGGLRTMPASYQWVTFADWAQKWGEWGLG